jgi:antitoxin FitA
VSGQAGPEPESQPNMCCTCDTLIYVSKMIQIRNVPDELHRTLKARAAKAGMTLSDYLLSEIEQIAEKPTLAEMMERLRQREPVDLDEPPDVTIRRLRDADDPRDAG